MSQAANPQALMRSNSLGTPDMKAQSPVDFTVNHSPSLMKIPANSGPVMLNVIAKLKNSYQLDISQSLKRASSLQDNNYNESLLTSGQGLNRSTSSIEKYNHLLIATVKDT